MRQVALSLALSLPLLADSILLDDKFADANSQNQDLSKNSVWLYNGRATTVRTDQPGSVSFDVTNAGGSEGFWAFFTEPGKPIDLGIGDKLTVAVTFAVSGFQNNGQDVRWGVLDSKGTRNSTNLAGGMNDATFINDTGYGLDYYASGTGSPFVIGRRAVLSNANVFNNFGDFTAINGNGANARVALADNTANTLTYTIERLSATDTRITASVGDLSYTATESSATPNTTFDYFAFRITGAGFATKVTFSGLQVVYAPAAPAILSQPRPPALTLQVGGTVNMSIAASGSALTYQWTRDGAPISGNASALGSNLTLTKVQLADAGLYRCVVTNAGGSVTSDPVTLKVSVDAVPPAPAITKQPASTTVTVGAAAALGVTATGSNLVFQWFRNGGLLVGATDEQLVFPAAKVTDSADYHAVVSNSSGRTVSDKATLLVASAMSAVSFTPSTGAMGLCADTTLSIQFDRPVRVGAKGRLTIRNSQGKAVDVIDVMTNPQTRMVGGVPYAYFPIIIDGVTASIYPHQPLPSADTYSVIIDPGVFLDSDGAPFAGIADDSTWRFDSQALSAGSGDMTVAADGTGDFCTVQAAIDAVPANNKTAVTITVQPGTYTEMLYVPSSKPFITLQGTDRDQTVIRYSDNNNLNPSNARALLGLDAPDFTLQDLTVWNTTPRGGSQAEAVRANNKRILLNRVNAKSYQDTVWLQGTVAVMNSYIEGDVDFNWGYGSVYFKNTEVKALTSGGYYTQIRNDNGVPGNVYVDCQLTAADGVSGMYLGRIDPTVFPYSHVVHINSQMGQHVAPAGWLLNNATTAPSISYWEFNSTDAAGAKLDVSQRLSFSRQITADEAAKWSDPGFVLGGWVPSTVNAQRVRDGSIRLDWTAPAGAGRSVAVYRKGAREAIFQQRLDETSAAGRVNLGQFGKGEFEIRLTTPGGARVVKKGF